MSNLGYQALGRLRFETYHDKLNHISVAATYNNQNGGYYGYMCGIRYIYWVPQGDGSFFVYVRNFSSDQYNNTAANAGDFSFNYNTIVSVQANVTSSVALGTPNIGVIFSLPPDASYIVLRPYHVTGGTVANYT